jgi:hypothetical protein
MTAQQTLVSVTVGDNGVVTVMYDKGGSAYQDMAALEFVVNDAAQGTDAQLQLLLLLLYMQDGKVGKTATLDTLQPVNVVTING